MHQGGVRGRAGLGQLGNPLGIDGVGFISLLFGLLNIGVGCSVDEQLYVFMLDLLRDQLAHARRMAQITFSAAEAVQPYPLWGELAYALA